MLQGLCIASAGLDMNKAGTGTRKMYQKLLPSIGGRTDNKLVICCLLGLDSFEKVPS